MDAEELCRRYAAGERDFHGVDLSGVNLEEVCLEEINLEGADLKGTLFFRCNLRGAIFRNANLEGADLSMTLLNETDFRGANLTSCRTLECSMIRANFQDARDNGMIWDGYTYNTVLPDGRVVSDPDPERDRQIAEGYEF
ncbi:pentapeptide repeat-containing protein [Nostoc sp. NOS(2021)]|uniref:pentapeptide repeat-containing protein n=1 Tax=Nostoc sp. NOS(2021) TaxID=2815407 RepID=UPI0025FB2E03|nr:pentapeptide repeat-containing protein [Nostoc sp. NOS(2021)]